jgi:hypothetical protein
MNKLSWFLYAVDVVGSLREFLVAAFIIVFIGILLTLVFGHMVIDTSQYGDEKKASHKKLNEALIKPIVVAMLISFFTVFIPSQKTMYLILGSEVGESVVMSETGQRVQDAINKRLDEYLSEESQ